MMETFIVLGLCFILYEALDFFQGCMHSATPNTTDQIDAYRRQLDEQRQQQQQEQFLANLTPLLGAQLLAASNASLSPSDSTASVISDQLRAHHHREQLEQLQRLRAAPDYDDAQNSASSSVLNSGSANNASVGGGSCSSSSASVAANSISGGFRPAYRSVYESQELYATSSLPRDYYYLQQQQLKNKSSSRSLLSKFGASNSDNRIHPEAPSILGVPAGVITTQPVATANAFDCLPPAVLPVSPPLALDLKRAILSNCPSNENHNRNIGSNNILTNSKDNNAQATLSELVEQENQRNRVRASRADEEFVSASESDSDISSGGESSDSASASAGSASLASCGEDSDQGGALDDREFALGSHSSSHGDFREIECERLRRKCVSVKRIYSISEKF